MCYNLINQYCRIGNANRKEMIAMSIQKRLKFCKTSPHLNKIPDFYVDYEVINLIDSSHSIKISFSCSHSSQCPLDDTNEWPLFINAPTEIS